MIRNIPQGTKREDIKARQEIIIQFYKSWKIANPKQCIYNTNIHDYIYINKLSIKETADKASLSYATTKKVFELTEVLMKAVLVKTVNTKKNNTSQKDFTKILIMKHKSIKLTVGVFESGKKIQYCITDYS